MPSGAVLESLALKRVRSFALFAAKKKLKYQSACDLFGQAARAYLLEEELEKAAECCKQQARLCINKLQQPVESAMHYMEATRAYMLAEDYTSAFATLQLAVQARTHPKVKHKFDNPHAQGFSVTGITVMDSQSPPVANLSPPPSGSASSDSSILPPELLHSNSAGAAPSSRASPASPPRPHHSALFSAASAGMSTGSAGRSPALTSQAGTITAEKDGKSLFLSPETMYPPISAREGRSASLANIHSHSQQQQSSSDSRSRSISIQPHPTAASSSSSSSSSAAATASCAAPAAPAAPSNLFSRAVSSPGPDTINSSSSSAGTALPVLSVGPTPAGVLASRQRRHSLSGSANSNNVTVEGVAHHDVLHLDLLLARLAVQLGADLWVHLDFRDAILCLEIASSVFAMLLIAERQQGTFRRRKNVAADGASSNTLLPAAPLPFPVTRVPQHALPGSSPASPEQHHLMPADALMQRAESAAASSPNTPTRSPTTAPKRGTAHDLSLHEFLKNEKTLAIQERLAGLLGPAALSGAGASSQTLGTLTLSSRPIVSKPVPKLLAAHRSELELMDKAHLVLHASDPYLSVGEGEGFLSDADDDSGTTILEESLVCRMQLASYYITFDEELALERSPENQELRRSKALFEQVASQKPDTCLLHANILPALMDAMCDSLLPPYICPRAIHDVANEVSSYAADDEKLHQCLFYAGLCDALINLRVLTLALARPSAPAPKRKFMTPAETAKAAADAAAAELARRNVPPIPELFLERVVFCPPILLRYRDMCDSFGVSPELRLLRSCFALCQKAGEYRAELNGHMRLFQMQASYTALVTNEFAAVVDVFSRQRPLTNIAAKLLLQIKKQIKVMLAAK